MSLLSVAKILKRTDPLNVQKKNIKSAQVRKRIFSDTVDKVLSLVWPQNLEKTWKTKSEVDLSQCEVKTLTKTKRKIVQNRPINMR